MILLVQAIFAGSCRDRARLGSKCFARFIHRQSREPRLHFQSAVAESATACAWNRRPSQTGQVTKTSARNCISIFSAPEPLQRGQRPMPPLKEKSLEVNHSLASCADSVAPKQLAHQIVGAEIERGIRARRPRERRLIDANNFGDEVSAAHIAPRPTSSSSSSERTCFARRAGRDSSTWCTNVLLPEPLTPLTADKQPQRNLARRSFADCSPLRFDEVSSSKVRIGSPDGVYRAAESSWFPLRYAPVSECGSGGSWRIISRRRKRLRLRQHLGPGRVRCR